MRLEDLVAALLERDALAARQWVMDASRAGVDWASLPAPRHLDEAGWAVAAGVAELLAERAGQKPPDWTRAVPGLAQPIFLVRAAARLPRLRRLCELEGPEPLRKRGVFAPPEFLTAA